MTARYHSRAEASTRGSPISTLPRNFASFICSNEVIPEGLTSFEQMNDAKFRGKVLIGDPRVLASARLWYLAVIQKFGEGFLRDLGKHAAFSPSVVPGLQQVASGAMAIYAPTILLSANDIIDRGAPIKYVIAEPVVISQSLAAIPAKA